MFVAMRTLLFLLTLAAGSLAAQSGAPAWYGSRAPGGSGASPEGATRGEVRIFSDPVIDALVAEHQRVNLEEGTVVGQRIQVFASPVLAETRAARAMFLESFPEWTAEIVLEAPDFKLLVGAYTDRFEAHRAWQTLIPEYPGSFLVRQLLPVSEL